MELYELVAVLRSGTGDAQTAKTCGPDERIFAKTAEQARDIYRERNGKSLTEARKEGTVTVLCRRFQGDC